VRQSVTGRVFDETAVLKPCESSVDRPDPERAGAIHVERLHPLARQPDLRESAAGSTHEATTIGANPQIAFSILRERDHVVARERRRVAVVERRELDAVEANEAFDAA
jgi:hypothetical protein